MEDSDNLNRFIKAQETDYGIALTEIKKGHKRSHWMWYVFPQLKGLGYSEMAKFYGIKSIDEAEAYFQHPLLGQRLIEICEVLLQLPGNNATIIFGGIDDLKLRSSMTLLHL